MRINTGKFKGRILEVPKGIRPTQEKVRKALFDILGDIEGLSFLELFAGSAGVGFEAVSRGVSELILVESNRNCQIAIKKNIESLGVESCCLYPQEAEKAIERIFREKKKFDIIFLDPPYYKNMVLRLRSVPKENVGESLVFRPRSVPKESVGESLAKKTLQTLGAYDILAPNGFIIAQHFKKDVLPENIDNLRIFKQAGYGDTFLSFYRKEEIV
jgi:16S rRNA (guanine(966)-N(2))-methyltransferase RsmD